MRLGSYIKDKLVGILLIGLGLFLLSLYLLAVGNNITTVLVIGVVWAMVSIGYLGRDYRNRKRYFNHINVLMEELDQPYLVQEFMEESFCLEDELYRDILKKSNKAVIERIYSLEKEQQEYKEFIEGWIHEVKLPITSIRLGVVNGSKEGVFEQGVRGRMESYLSQLEHCVDQALFYARSDQVYKDFLIQEVELKTMIQNVLKKDKHLFIYHNMSAKIEVEDITVYSDGKWLEFIIGQIVYNGIKYKKKDDGLMSFQGEELGEGIKLVIRDNGMGISESDMPRIFDKGFTGSNGREKGKATGMGLYLCKKLCMKLGISIHGKSKQGEYTEITMLFPKHSFLSKR